MTLDAVVIMSAKKVVMDELRLQLRIISGGYDSYPYSHSSAGRRVDVVHAPRRQHCQSLTSGRVAIGFGEGLYHSL